MLKPKGNVRDLFRKQVAQMQRKLERAAITYLSYLGELCVNHARSLSTYRDQTGNLRNSIGYVIAKNGKVVKSNFEQTRAGAGGSALGKLSGRNLAYDLAAQALDGYTLIVVAGMNYALAVESRGLDVLSSAEQLAQSEFPKLMADLKLTIEQL